MAININNYTLKEVLLKRVNTQTKFGEGKSIQPNSPINYRVGMGGGVVKSNPMQGIIVLNLKVEPANTDETKAFEFDADAIALYESTTPITDQDLQELAGEYAHKEIWPVMRQESQNILRSMGILITLPLASPVKVTTP